MEERRVCKMRHLHASPIGASLTSFLRIWKPTSPPLSGLLRYLHLPISTDFLHTRGSPWFSGPAPSVLATCPMHEGNLILPAHPLMRPPAALLQAAPCLLGCPAPSVLATYPMHEGNLILPASSLLRPPAALLRAAPCLLGCPAPSVLATCPMHKGNFILPAPSLLRPPAALLRAAPCLLGCPAQIVLATCPMHKGNLIQLAHS
jgi:hypothetical protein